MHDEASECRTGAAGCRTWSEELPVRGIQLRGERAAAVDTLIGTAKLNGIDPELYLRTFGPSLPRPLRHTHPVTIKNQWALHDTLYVTIKRGSAYAYGPPGPCVGSEQPAQNGRCCFPDLYRYTKPPTP